MNAVAARKSGAPSFSIRASSLVLAALATGVPLFLLILGLSIQTLQAIRERALSVELIPVPPPPPPEQTRPERARPAEHAAAPAPEPPRPATLIGPSAPIVPQPLPPPPAADTAGTGAGTTPGAGTGGSGTGGTGDGAGGAPVSGPVLAGASWINRPSPAELQPFNPQQAQVEQVSGQVVLACRVLRNRTLADCRIRSERPRGYGFGAAALQASRTFRFNPPTIDGEPDEARRIEIPVDFNNRRR
ncbi:energy transducer TonB [Sphingomonas sp. LB-2]|uniref:energy transducer TonB n=1 Tax=Sphingomonas caeni TaxID=2984949 RepID=UPI00222E8E74|nr:energy transducer TonB [Sphingomonas caeni]MCW3846616.1 energy transducer TonB [Sphingomonas caeni]